MRTRSRRRTKDHESFHVWRMDWTAERIEIYVDDLLLNTIELKKTVNADREGANPFHDPHYMILNLAIAGTQGGDPSETEFPARFEVDYVRVYQRRPGEGKEKTAAPDAEESR